uniref:Ig-like domain-containing protein n=1 Tax=Timema tahoe TaxID=61484 RepID=A0A7R9FFA4_9NEOP|nr:unnamed protein product [Timema tahoe]
MRFYCHTRRLERYSLAASESPDPQARLTVSWIRRRDSHILTVDRYTFIADERFQAFLVEATDTWTLQIKYVQARDAGQYECQVSTEPKMSHFITLNVVVELNMTSALANYATEAGVDLS